MILVVATVRLHPGQAGAYEAGVAKVMPEVRAANPGVLFYHAGKCREEPDTYRVVEAYADQPAMDTHIASERLQASLMALMPLIESVEIKLHDTVA